MEVITAPLFEDGEVAGVVTAFQDITERKQTEQELDRYHHHLEELVLSRTADLAEAKDAAEAANIDLVSCVASDTFCCRDAIKSWHLDVHENTIIVICPQRFQYLVAITDGRDDESGFFKQLFDAELAVIIILC